MTYTADSDMAAIIDKNGNTWSFAYTTNNGRLLSVTDPLAQVEQFDFVNGLPGQQLGHYTDVRGKTWTHTFATTRSFFGNLLRAQNTLNQVQSWIYSDAIPALRHEPISYVNALGKTWPSDYDANGNLLSTADPLGNKTSYTYDPLNNLLTLTPPGATPVLDRDSFLGPTFHGNPFPSGYLMADS